MSIVEALTNMPKPSDLLQGTLDLLILRTIARKPLHGWGIAKRIQTLSGDTLSVGQGSLYPALQRLLKEGLLESKEGISAKGRPTRIYRLTNSGIRHLEREVTSFEKMFTGITLVLAAAKV